MSANQKQKRKKSAAKLSKGRIRLHRLAWKLFRPLTGLLMGRLYGFHAPVERDLPPCFLLLCNHVTRFDPLLLPQPIPRQMYFVASEHILRMKIAPLMMFLASPITRRKSRTETSTALEIIRRLRAGCSVCVFIEGERSYGGQTEFIPDSAAHLAKTCGYPLVTYRLENGYLTEPRWASSIRKNGRMSGGVVGIYGAEELKAMSREQVLERIRQDLWLDAYEQQEKETLTYPGKNLAEHLETALFYCPRCRSLGRLTSRGDWFFCPDCGLKLRFNEQGYFESEQGDPPPFTTVRDWYNWQKQETVSLAQAHLGRHHLLARDEDQHLFAVDEENHSSRLLSQGTLSLYGDGLEFCGSEGDFELKLPLSQLKAISCHESKLLSFSVKDGSDKTGFYEVDSPFPRSAHKYQLLFRGLRETPPPEG